MPSLAANFFSENRDKPFHPKEAGANMVFPNQKLFFTFSSPPNEAEDVLVRIVEDVEFLDTQVDVKGRLLGEMRGKIDGSKFIPEIGKIQPALNKIDPLKIEMDYEHPSHGAELEVPLPEAEVVERHSLRLVVQGKVAGQLKTFTSKALVDGRYPLAMVVPKGAAQFDAALDMLKNYAKHWKTFDENIRHVEGTKMLVTKDVATLEPKHFDDIVRALEAAALANPATGVIALAVGHGGGTNSPTPFFDLLPEDNKRKITNREPVARITKTLLTVKQSGFTVVPTSRADRVRLNAMDRIADKLAKTKIRRLILHTCNAGLDQDFVQLIADRLRVPVAAQRKFLLIAPTFCHYEGTNPVLPRDEKHWVVKHLGTVRYPSKKPPPRFEVDPKP